jgi:SulP family sulfate permease
MGTVVNIQAGAKSALSGVIRVIVLIIVMFGAAQLTQNIPLAVLAGIALKVGLNILDWSFVKRAHKVSWQAAMIMYGVMALTIFVDLIVAVGIGVFIANIITIEQLSALQSKNVRSISDSDDRITLSAEEKSLLKLAKDQILLVYLSGPMIFGVSKAIAREHRAISKYKSVLLDLSHVPHMDTTVSLAIENMIKEAVELNRNIYMVKPGIKAYKTLKRLGVFEMIPEEHVCKTRIEALKLAQSSLELI